MISFAFLPISGVVSNPGPDTGQIRSLPRTRASGPGTSIQNRTVHQPPCLSGFRDCPERRAIDLPLFLSFSSGVWFEHAESITKSSTILQRYLWFQFSVHVVDCSA